MTHQELDDLFRANSERGEFAPEPGEWEEMTALLEADERQDRYKKVVSVAWMLLFCALIFWGSYGAYVVVAGSGFEEPGDWNLDAEITPFTSLQSQADFTPDAPSLLSFRPKAGFSPDNSSLLSFRPQAGFGPDNSSLLSFRPKAGLGPDAVEERPQTDFTPDASSLSFRPQAGFSPDNSSLLSFRPKAGFSPDAVEERPQADFTPDAPSQLSFRPQAGFSPDAVEEGAVSRTWNLEAEVESTTAITRLSPKQAATLPPTTNKQATPNIATAQDASLNATAPTLSKSLASLDGLETSPTSADNYYTLQISSVAYQTLALLPLEWSELGKLEAISPIKAQAPKESNTSFSIGALAAGEVNLISLNSGLDWGARAGVVGHLQFGPHWETQLGISYGRKNYHATTDEYMTEPGFWVDDIAASDATGKASVLEIPLLATYHLRDARTTSGPFVSAGLSSYLLRKEQLAYQYQEEAPGQNHGHTVSDIQSSILGMAQVQLGYRLLATRKVAYRLSTYAALPLQGVGFGDVRLYTGGVSLELELL